MRCRGVVRRELQSTLRSRRWAAVVAAGLLAAYLAAGDVGIVATNADLTPGALDVHAAAANNVMYTGYLLFTAFIFVVGDTLIADRTSGRCSYVFARGVERGAWWRAKAAGVLLAASITQLAFLASCIVVGAWHGWPLERTVSRLAGATAAERGMALFPPLSGSVDMLARQVGVAGYLTLCFSALGVAILALTLRARHSALPVTLALVALMVDYVVAKAWEPWTVVSPGMRLMEGVHAENALMRPIPLWSSVVYFGAILAVSSFAGQWALRRQDL